MTSLTLYPDQLELVDNVREAMRHNKYVLLQSPTGSGKTQIATHIIKEAKNKSNNIVFTVPRKSLLEQTSDNFDYYGINHSYIAAGRSYNPFAEVHIGMIDSMARRLDKLPNSKLVIVDEARHGGENMDKVIKHYKAQGAYILGLDATPKAGMDKWYDHIIAGKQISWLIENKRLSDYRYFYGVTRPDLTRINMVAGEYNQTQLADYMEHENAIIGDCVRDYKARCMGKIHIVRCSSIKHSQIVAQSFNDVGITALHIDGKTEMLERKRIFTAFADREIHVLCFADLLNMGIDLGQIVGRNVCIQSSSNLKPSKSLSSVMQFWGRSLRYQPEPSIFNDHVNAYMEHGFPKDDREWSLASITKGMRVSSEKAVAVMSCPICYYCHPPVADRKCPNCGFIHPIKERKINSVDGELVEHKDGAVIIKKPPNRAGQRWKLIALAKAKHIPNPERYADRIIAAQIAKEQK